MYILTGILFTFFSYLLLALSITFVFTNDNDEVALFGLTWFYMKIITVVYITRIHSLPQYPYSFITLSPTPVLLPQYPFYYPNTPYYPKHAYYPNPRTRSRTLTRTPTLTLIRIRIRIPTLVALLNPNPYLNPDLHRHVTCVVLALLAQ